VTTRLQTLRITNSHYKGDGDPYWGDKNSITATQLILSEIAMFRIELKDGSGSLGWSTIPISSIRPVTISYASRFRVQARPFLFRTRPFLSHACLVWLLTSCFAPF
jgi:hypothetical protein